ncbi:hypothetical protein B0G73_12539 [Paraburkholderia sp. BL25I1N1]|nr:hypothetical protein B0G73_12539 [Paraburkholderia sp. BL25I1N1]
MALAWWARERQRVCDMSRSHDSCKPYGPIAIDNRRYLLTHQPPACGSSNPLARRDHLTLA